MGYTTEFDGSVAVTPPLNEAEITYLNDFGDTRRMDRANGPYYAKARNHGVSSINELNGFNDKDVRNQNQPPAGQPGLWCQWRPTEDGAGLEWDGSEKFYAAEEWMRYLIDHFLRPGALALDSPHADPRFEDFTFDHVVNGEIIAQGEDPEDRWKLVVTDNVVERVNAVFGWER